MQRRTLIVSLASASVAVPLAGCSGTNEKHPEEEIDVEGVSVEGTEIPEGNTPEDETEGNTPETEGNTPEDESEDRDDPRNGEEPTPLTFEGNGQAVTDEFDLIGGFALIDLEHNSDGNDPQIRLINKESSYMVQSVSNGSDEWSGQVGETFDPGTYMLDINVGGEWSIEIQQPRPTEGDHPPIEESCTTSTVIGPYMIDGHAQIAASYDGDNSFIVRTHEAGARGGTFGNVIFNSIGELEDTTTVSSPGLTWITVIADGDWELEIEYLKESTKE